MSLNELYEIAEKSNIRVDEFRLSPDTKSLAVYIDGKYAVALDISKLKTNADIVTALAHELGHCKTHSFYNINNILDVRTKHEYNADKWACENLLPKDEMQEAFEKGYVEVWQLAEYFEVSENLIKKALWIYFDKTA